MKPTAGWKKIEDNRLVVRWIDEKGMLRSQGKRIRLDCPLTREEVHSYIVGGYAMCSRHLSLTRPSCTNHAVRHLIMEATLGPGPQSVSTQQSKTNGRPRTYVRTTAFSRGEKGVGQ